MEDLREADLSARPEEALTEAERLELKRRLVAFVTALKEQDLLKRAKRPGARPRTVRKWRPSAVRTRRG